MAALQKKFKKTSLNKLTFLFLFFAQAAICAPIKVLITQSMIGKGSLGEWIAEAFSKSCTDCSVQWIQNNDAGGIIGKLRGDFKRNAKKIPYDMVLGLESFHYQTAKKEGLLESGHAFESAPYAIIVNTKKLPVSSWPKSWKELPQKLNKQLLIQDPRTSEVALGWLESIFSKQLLTLAESSSVVGKIFPSWSSAYSAFSKGEYAAVWSYLSSEAYHRCEDKTEQFLALPLKEGYPTFTDYVAPITGQGKKKNVTAFIDFLLSKTVQEKIPEKNWMFPTNKAAQLPDCYKKISAVHSLPENTQLTPKLFQSWVDSWSLQP